jgi:hypothetical protein
MIPRTRTRRSEFLIVTKAISWRTNAVRSGLVVTAHISDCSLCYSDRLNVFHVVCYIEVGFQFSLPPNLSSFFHMVLQHESLLVLLFWGFLITQNYTPGRTPLDEWSALRSGLYLHSATQLIYIRETFMPSARFEPAIPATKRPQTYALDRTATGIGYSIISLSILFWNKCVVVDFRKEVRNFRSDNLFIERTYITAEPKIFIWLTVRPR